MISLESPITELKFVGIKMLPKLKKLGINTVRDLLWHFPVRYEDLSTFKTISQVDLNEKISIVGTVKEISNVRTPKRRMIITKALIEDNTGSIYAIWFNQPYLAHTLKSNLTVNFSGKVIYDARYGAYLQNPSYEIVGKQEPKISNLKHTGRLIPVYPETGGLTSRYLRLLIAPILKMAISIPDPIPQEVLKRQKLYDLKTAINQIHFPSSLEKSEKARERLAFEELFTLQIQTLIERKKIQKQSGYLIPFNQELIKNFVGSLPFKLTDAQRLSLWEIIKDLEKPYPMNRLLNGDVGSGKTIVAAAAALEAVRAGYQAVFMAPTEVLANQHFQTISHFLENFGLKIGLMTSGKKMVFDDGLSYDLKKESLIEKIHEGKVDIIIGTHALIQEGVSFKNLALVVIDEQHRFGVEQRAKLIRHQHSQPDKYPVSNKIPHLLSMTATPIPRTLTLTIYGDLDISILNQMPKGRKKIITKLVSLSQRQAAYNFIRKEIKNGRQVFVICPRIETPEENSVSQKAGQLSIKDYLNYEVKAVKAEHKRLQEVVFPDLKIGLLHGKMKPKEKTEIMTCFKNKDLDILVATSVIEVGVDVPNASVMMIEGAEHFGLAQLHQFRGRVGRSEHQSYCFLFTESPEVFTTKRLEAVVNSTDGFKLAEMDLKIRGPGEFLGTQQSGMPDLAMASLADIELIKKARTEAETILQKDSDLDNFPFLKQKLISLRKTIHLE